jgi:hypothetical protein
VFPGLRKRNDLGTARKRTVALLAALAVLGVPAFILHVACVGSSCERVDAATTDVPFCSLESDLRDRIVTGFHDGRSPDVLAIARDRRVFGATGQPSPGWPSIGTEPMRVPIAFMGAGVNDASRIPSATRLDAIAPTIAEIIGLDRPHPEVRSGRAIEGIASGERPRLVVLIAMTGVTSDDIDANEGHVPFLGNLSERGPATLDGDPGSLPLDPAAVLTTIGTGGLPRQHGITGRFLRNDAGAMVEAWGPNAPVSVIATLADDLDETLSERPEIGLVGSHRTDLGLIGGNWYVGVDADDVEIDDVAGRQAQAVDHLLSEGYGDDGVPDLLAVALSGDAVAADAALTRIVRAAERAVPRGATIVVTGTGIEGEGRDAAHDKEIVADVNERMGADLIQGTALGGFFVDQRVLAREGIAEEDVVRMLRRFEVPAGGAAFEDVFPAISVSLARYC